ncbi:MAG: RnfABCDGE type electron transport complex subunit G [Candidatus Omnitrophota bacterium]
MKNILRFAFILFLVNLIAASVLAGTYNLTKSRIEEQERLAQEQALKQVMPEEIGDRLELAAKDGAAKYWKVFKQDSAQVRGYVFIAKRYGYSSVIETMVGMKKDGTITGIKVLSQNETPGLGAKITEPYFIKQFVNRDINALELSKNNIHAITGATISSRAILGSIKFSGTEMLNNKNE